MVLFMKIFRKRQYVPETFTSTKAYSDLQNASSSLNMPYKNEF